MVVIRIYDLSGNIQMGFRKVTHEVAEKALVIAQSKGRMKISLPDLDDAQLQISDELRQSKLRHPSSRATYESELPEGYRLDGEQGLVRDFTIEQVREMD